MTNSAPTDWSRDTVFINGSWQSVGAYIDVENPATEEIIGSGADGGAAHVDAAVAAAREAFEMWGRTSRTERADHLESFHRALTARRHELIAATVAEVGAPVRIAREAHVEVSLEILASYIALLREEHASEQLGNSTIVREPAGVVGSITPWNYPLYQLMIKVAAALSAGCTVVAKLAELTPITAYLLSDAIAEARLPAGVFNLVPGTGPKVGEAIALHPDIDVVSFTGSTGVGSRVAELAAKSLKRVCLELGGKSASVVLDDADLETAVRATVDSATYNSGQTCSAWTRLVVPVDRYEEAVTLATQRARELVVGDPANEKTDLGPLISKRQLDAVANVVWKAAEAGAHVEQIPLSGSSKGYYAAPVIVSGVASGDKIAQDELFGPVLVVLSHQDDDDAVRIANDSQYGLAGAVWAGSDDRALKVANQMRTGQVDINGATLTSTPHSVATRGPVTAAN